MISEFSASNNRGLLASLPALGVSLGILIGTAMFAALSMLPKYSFMEWGWRIPFLLGFTLVIVGLYVRRQIHETPAFQQLQREQGILNSPLLHVMKHEFSQLVIAAGARSADAVGGQFFNVFAIAYCTTAQCPTGGGRGGSAAVSRPPRSRGRRPRGLLREHLHAELLKSVARRIVDRRVLHLIKMWLESPVEETDDRGRKTRTTTAQDNRRGIPQGSPISPLLANLYMRRFVLE